MIHVSMAPDGETGIPQTSRSEVALESADLLESTKGSKEKEEFPLPKAEISVGSFSTSAFDSIQKPSESKKLQECQVPSESAGQIPEMKDWLSALKRSDEQSQPPVVDQSVNFDVFVGFLEYDNH